NLVSKIVVAYDRYQPEPTRPQRSGRNRNRDVLLAVEVLNETQYDIEIQRIVELAEHLYQPLHIHHESELAIVFVDNDAMATLHQQLMGLDGLTDVMSFPMDELRPGSVNHPATGMLGDIVISP